jgi:hypothetical protein
MGSREDSDCASWAESSQAAGVTELREQAISATYLGMVVGLVELTGGFGLYLEYKKVPLTGSWMAQPRVNNQAYNENRTAGARSVSDVEIFFAVSNDAKYGCPSAGQLLVVSRVEP